MPWSETTAMDEKVRFLQDWRGGRQTVSDLCARYNISRKTGYKWAQRFVLEGPDGLLDRSHATRSSPHRTSEEVEQTLVLLRLRFPSWGAKKLMQFLHDHRPELELPHRSTVCEILSRNDLVHPRPRRRPVGHPGRPSSFIHEPNDCWSADFKGQFRTADGRYCYPLTMTDNCSRYILACEGMSGPLLRPTQQVYTRVFEEFGLPKRLRTDSGVPFAGTGLGRLSSLSVWLIRLGVLPELIEPGKPQQNGRHERMHKTLKAETTQPPAANLAAQQRRFDTFRQEFNELRPHEALDMKAPATVHQNSPRRMPAKLPPLEYPQHFQVRYISANGGMRWRSQWVSVTSALVGQYIGLEAVDDGIWDVHFGIKKIGRLHERHMRIEDELGRLRRR